MLQFPGFQGLGLTLSGQGILACVAAAAGASVIAFECNTRLAKTAERIAADNALTIEVLHVHSTVASSRPGDGWTTTHGSAEHPRGALLSHELLDSGLLSEGLLCATRHAHDVLLTPTAVTVPHAVRLYAQPVHCPFFRDASTLAHMDHLLPLPPEVALCAGGAGYIELDAAPLFRQRLALELSPPIQLLEIELSSRPPEGEQLIGPIPVELSARCEADGSSIPGLRVDAIVTWWECDVHPQLPPLSTSPWRLRTGLEREHWLNAVFLCAHTEARSTNEPPPPPPEDAGPSAPRGGCVVGGYDDHELWLRWVARSDAAQTSDRTQRVCRCGVHVLWGPERLQQLRSSYTPNVIQAIRAKLASISIGSE